MERRRELQPRCWSLVTNLEDVAVASAGQEPAGGRGWQEAAGPTGAWAAGVPPWGGCAVAHVDRDGPEGGLTALTFLLETAKLTMAEGMH